MKSKFTFIATLLMGIIFAASAAFCAELKGAANSRPNLSGGYDFYDSSGKKTGYSTKRTDGGYNYYNQYGNKTGSLQPDSKGSSYQYYDADGVQRGEVTTEPHGGYRYYEKKESLETPEQMQIRRNREYQDQYGSGIETLPPGVIKGEK